MADSKRNLTWKTAPETLKVSEAAQLAGLHINTIRAAIHDGHLQATKPTGSHWRIQKENLRAFVEHSTQQYTLRLDQTQAVTVNDRLFWQAIYRAVMAAAAAIQRYKLKKSCQEAKQVDIGETT